MSNVSVFAIILDYYAAVWKYFNIELLAELFADSIQYTYLIDGIPLFELHGKTKVISEYYKPWFDKCIISSTEIKEFCIVPSDEGIFYMKFREIVTVNAKRIESIAMHRLIKQKI